MMFLKCKYQKNIEISKINTEKTTFFMNSNCINNKNAYLCTTSLQLKPFIL